MLHVEEEEELLEPVEMIDIGVYGIWFWKLPDDFKETGLFPPRGTKCLLTIGGQYTGIEDIPSNWAGRALNTIEYEGADRITVGIGDRWKTYDVDEFPRIVHMLKRKAGIKDRIIEL